MIYTLGLDLGITSIGWSIIENEIIDNELSSKRLIDLGVRLFPNQFGQRGESPAVPRREARSLRRRLRRRKFRLLRLKEIFRDSGIKIPTQQEFRNFYYKRHDGVETSLRVKALDEIVDSVELFQILNVLLKRRGYKSNRIQDEEDLEEKTETKKTKKDESSYKSALSANQSLLITGGYRTVGEMLVKDPKFLGKKRNEGDTYKALFTRADLHNELDQILNSQIELGNKLVTNEFKNKVIALFDFQRPFANKDQIEKLIGKCSIFPEELRASKYSPFVQDSTAWQRLNNLGIIDPNKTELIHLSDIQKKEIYEHAKEVQKITFAQLRKILSLPEEIKFKGLTYPTVNIEKRSNPESSTFIELKTYHKFKKALQNQNHFFEKLVGDYDYWDKIVNALWLSYEDSELIKNLAEIEIVDSEIVGALSRIKSIDDTSNVSVKALKKILPELKEGMFFSDALAKVFPENKVVSTKKLLLPLIDIEEIKNPGVIRSLTQTRKVINAIIRKYGSPSFINIELSRDITRNQKERREIATLQQDNANFNQSIVEKLNELGVKEPSGKLVVKYKLWSQQDCKCGYSGKSITAQQLLSDENLVEIDHILPYSRSLDDSKSNQILVLSSENQQKGNKTPFEYFGHNKNRWSEMTNLWKYWFGKTNSSKLKKLLNEDYVGRNPVEFIERNLNDTRYITRFIKNYIEDNLVFENLDNRFKQRVFTYNGQFTGMIRKYFGFIKDRSESSRHHALDAVIVGISNLSMLHKVQNFYKNKESYEEYLKENHFPEPWDRFAEDVQVRIYCNEPKKSLEKLSLLSWYGEAEKYIRPLLVSRMVDRKITGQIHDATIRSIKEIQNEDKKENVFVVKKHIAELKKEHFDKNLIYGGDEATINVLRERLEKYDWKADKAFAEPIYKPSKNPDVKNQIKTVKLISGPANSFVRLNGGKGVAERASIVRTDIYKMNDKYYAVPIYADQAGRGELPNKAIVPKQSEDKWLDMTNAEFQFSLFKNDFVRLIKKGDLVFEGYFNSIHRRTGSINVLIHDGSEKERGMGIQNLSILKKLEVDYLGDTHEVKKEKRHGFQKSNHNKKIKSSVQK